MSAASSRIVIDTREQRGYTWDPDVLGNPTTTVGALPAGDYSIEGFEGRIAIERKSLDDFINTTLRASERFARELVLLQAYEFAAVVIEASPQIITERHYNSDISPASLLGIIAEYTVRFAPVQFVLAGDRPHARLLTERLLRFAARACAERDARGARRGDQ